MRAKPPMSPAGNSIPSDERPPNESPSTDDEFQSTSDTDNSLQQENDTLTSTMTDSIDMAASLSGTGMEDTPSNRVMVELLHSVNRMREESARDRTELRAWRQDLTNKVTALESEVKEMKSSQSRLVGRVAAVESNQSSNLNADSEARLKKMEEAIQVVNFNLVGKNSLAHILSKLEAQERELKKCNIVIRGLALPKQNLVASVTYFLKQNFGSFTGKVLEANTLKEGMICVKLDSLDSKKELYALKKISCPKGIYIQNDLTTSQQEAEFQLRKFAREKKAGGVEVKIFNFTAFLGDQQYRWDASKKTVALAKPRNFRKSAQSTNLTSESIPTHSKNDLI